MKKKDILYIILMVISFVFTYLFIYSGCNTLVKTFVNYQEKSDLGYKVYLSENDIYDSSILGMNKKYIASLIDQIVINFDYDILFDRYLSGFYSYAVSSSVVAYEDDINDPLWIKEYNELLDKVEVINQNKIDMIKISDKVSIDYQKYKKIIDDFKSDYDIDISGYLLVKVNIHMMVDFSGLNNQVDDSREIKIIIPLSYDTIKIDVINDNNKIDSYYEFTTKSDVNYLFLVLGAITGSIGLALLILIIKEMIEISRRQNKFDKELKHILKEHSEIIVKVDRLYNKKKYNLIYVDSFDELMDVYKKVETPISFKKMDKKREVIFLIIEDDNAWIYRLVEE